MAKKIINNKKNFSPIFLILLFSSTVTLFINSGLADPFNTPKFLLLILFGSWLLGFIWIKLAYISRPISLEIKIFLIILVGFILSLFISALNTQVAYNAFFGQVQRRLGFLTYFYFLIFMIASALFFKTGNILTLYKFIVFLSLILCIYGLLQTTGNDFIQWDNPYNSIILTLGNPNYASALMAILAILVLSLSINAKKIQKLSLSLLCLLLLILISLSNSRQGLVSFGFGAGLIFMFTSYYKSKKIGIMIISVITSIFSIVILGMLQIGPFTQYIYKASVSIRGYYWAAGIEMFKSNIFTGVGVDSYGEYFKFYREKQYPLNYGFLITSDNAHNVPIQLFATAGIFTGLFYMALIFYIVIITFKNIQKINGELRLLTIGIFAAWSAFVAQSIISIDNIGLTIWGWVLGGVLVGLYVNSDKNLDKNEIPKNSKAKTSFFDVKQKMVSSILLFLSFILCSYLYQGERYMYQLSTFVNNKAAQQSEMFRTYLDKFDNADLVEPAYRFRVANILFQLGEIEDSEKRVEVLLENNPRNYDYLFGMAQIKAFKKDWQSVINIRIKIKEIDPWNAENYYLLAEAYKNFGDIDGAIINYKKILSFAQNEEIGKEAQIALEGITLK